MEVKAQLNNYRRSPRKVRLVAKLLKGVDVQEAENQLRFTVKGSAPDIEKLLRSALANAENNFGLEKDNLFIKEIKVNEGAKLKRWLPRAYGRASLILKRTSHIELILAEKVEGKGRKKVKKQEINDVTAQDLKKTEGKGAEEQKEEKKPARIAMRSVAGGEAVKAREEKEFMDDKKKVESSKGILKKVFRRKSM